MGIRIRAQVRVILLFAAAGLCIGWGGSWEEMRSAAGTVKAVQAEFIQEKHMKILARPLVSSGVFYYRSPASLRWEYQAPLRNILLMDAERTERWVEAGGRLVKEAGANLQAMQVVLEHITQWLDGRFDDNPMFAANLEPGPKITLVPKEKAFAKMIERIELLFSSRPGVIEAVVIHESADSFTRLVFKNVVLNPSIDDAVFRKIS